jgi:hypothetical protein
VPLLLACSVCTIIVASSSLSLSFVSPLRGCM